MQFKPLYFDMFFCVELVLGGMKKIDGMPEKMRLDRFVDTCQLVLNYSKLLTNLQHI